MQLSCQFLTHAFLATSSPSPPKCYEVIVILEDKNISSVSAKISSYGKIVSKEFFAMAFCNQFFASY